jgi:hypothetical protein
MTHPEEEGAFTWRQDTGLVASPPASVGWDDPVAAIVPWRGGETRSHRIPRSSTCLAGPGGRAARAGDPDEPTRMPSGRTR